MHVGSVCVSVCGTSDVLSVLPDERPNCCAVHATVSSLPKEAVGTHKLRLVCQWPRPQSSPSARSTGEHWGSWLCESQAYCVFFFSCSTRAGRRARLHSQRLRLAAQPRAR